MKKTKRRKEEGEKKAQAAEINGKCIKIKFNVFSI